MPRYKGSPDLEAQAALNELLNLVIDQEAMSIRTPISIRTIEYMKRKRDYSNDPHAHRQAAYRQRCIDKFGGRPDYQPLARARWAASKLPHLTPIISLAP